jgi:hypothetical protein
MVKIFTIVKDEIDIIRDWIIYHGSLFGFNNIFVIDNYSKDGTYEAILEFKDLINISQESDYREKGVFMTELMKKHCMGDDKIAFPLDVDEFVVYYEKGSKEVIFDKNLIVNYFNTLPQARVYKMNFIIPTLLQKDGYQRAPAQIEYGEYQENKSFAKSFVNTKYFKGEFDHGNHLTCDDYYLTNLVLVHYHNRNLEQVIKKNKNHILGFRYPLELQELKNFYKKNPDCEGNHHVKRQIDIQENKYKFPYNENANLDNKISIKQLKERIIGGFF